MSISQVATRLSDELSIRTCNTISDFDSCVELQREAFGLCDVDLLPLRYFVAVTNAGGFTLGSFVGGNLVGFVTGMYAYIRGQRALYSHVAAVSSRCEGQGIGAALKWEQRSRALNENMALIRWAMDPAKARNAFFSVEKLGGVIREYRRNYQGSQQLILNGSHDAAQLDSDRVFVDWDLKSSRVRKLAAGETREEKPPVRKTISVRDNWSEITRHDPLKAISERRRIRYEFEKALSSNLECRAVERNSKGHVTYLFFDSSWSSGE